MVTASYIQTFPQLILVNDTLYLGEGGGVGEGSGVGGGARVGLFHTKWAGFACFTF